MSDTGTDAELSWNYSIVDLVIDPEVLNQVSAEVHVGTYLDCGYEILAVWAEPSWLQLFGKPRRKMLIRQKKGI